MKPFRHARNSVKKWGGQVADYLEIHNFMDLSKSAHADVRHRAIFHNSLGPYIVERVFGIPYAKFEELAERFDWSDEEKVAVMDLLKEAKTERATSMINSDGVRVQVRDVAEEHVIEDLGRIPPLSDWLKNMTMQTWFGGPKSHAAAKGGSKFIPFQSAD
jgi:hypothetical protein